MTTWKDIVKIGDCHYGEEHEISNEVDDDIFNCDDFFTAVEKKYNVSYEEIQTLAFDGISVPQEEIQRIGYGEESCGAYVNGKMSYI